MTTLDLKFKKHKIMMQHNIESFIRTQKQKQFLMKGMLKVYLNL